MSSERKTLNISAETLEYLESAGGRNEDESANDFLFRIAEMLDGGEAGTDVTCYDIGDESTPHEDTLTTEEFEAYIDDIAAEVARKTADEIEHRFR